MPDLIGQTLLNRYRVIESLGRGGAAEVYKVWDAHRSSFLAIKVLHADLALDRVFIRRFKREAQTLARLQHPNIVRFYDLEQDERLVFMLMDYVDGESLKHKIFDANGPMALAQVMDVMRPLCQALHFAHKEGFVHSDVKPGNVLIDKTGRVMLTDFGIARMTEMTTVTMVGAGTPAYMAPEQARGENPSAQSDIYALGVILFEMLTGERPFTGEHAKTGGSTSEKIRWEQINLSTPSPRQFNPNLSLELEAVTLNCLEKDAHNRYTSVMDILNALQNALGALSQQTPPPNMDNASTILKYKPPKLVKNEPSEQKAKVPARPRKIRTSPLAWLIGGVLVIFALLLGGKYAFSLASPTFLPTATRLPHTFTPTPSLGIGSTQISPKDGMAMVYVPAGEFKMGSEDGDLDEEPSHLVYLDSFWIDRTEVTNKQYAICLSAHKCTPPTIAASSTHSKYFGNSQFDDYPVIYVNWKQAYTYCLWAGRRLPTEAEWEKAARGIDVHTFPWGDNTPNNNLLNYARTIWDTTAVSRYPDGVSPYGAYDMAGNVEEWVSSLFEPYPYNALDGRENLNSSSKRVIRGGSWYSYFYSVRSSNRVMNVPTYTSKDLGFRCAQSTSH